MPQDQATSGVPIVARGTSRLLDCRLDSMNWGDRTLRAHGVTKFPASDDATLVGEDHWEAQWTCAGVGKFLEDGTGTISGEIAGLGAGTIAISFTGLVVVRPLRLGIEVVEHVFFVGGTGDFGKIRGGFWVRGRMLWRCFGVEGIAQGRASTDGDGLAPSSEDLQHANAC